ncbi:MAG: LPS export ABC transporter periplasmic protein LptC [Planctomycetes bacterium]|nr:LPS export ABC transporter periplasmic protein LptC [Planctomycetota bacterium]
MARSHSLLALLVLAAAALRAGEGPKEHTKTKAPADKAKEIEVPFYDPDTGELLWKVRAREVTTDPADPGILNGADVELIGYSKGKTRTITARKGKVSTQSRDVALRENVVINLPDEGPTRVETDDLYWDNKNRTASTKGPVKITRPDMVLTGMGMRLWLALVRGEDDQRQRTALLVVERQVRSELLPGAGAALLDGGGRGGDEPIVVTCDGPLLVSRAELRAVYRNSVRASQGKQSLTCDVLTVEARAVPGEKGKVTFESGLATGNVRVDDAQAVAVGDSAAWSRERGSMTLTGRPAEVRWDNGNRIVAGLVQRSGDGAEILCSATPEHPRDVYLLAHTVESAAQPAEKREPGELGSADVADWPALCTALDKQAAAKDPSPGKRLMDLLPPDAQAAVRAAAKGTTLGQKRKAELATAINGVLRRPDFYREADFKGVVLPAEAQELLKPGAKALSEAQARKLNRALLGVAFPGHLAKPR